MPLPKPSQEKDKRWIIRTFRPLLKLLDAQNLPDQPRRTRVNLADHRDLTIKGMGRCIVAIKQADLPKNLGGMLVTSHRKIPVGSGFVYSFRLNILINKSLCNKPSDKKRALLKLTVVHEFTHAIAALSALSRIRTEAIIERFKATLRQKEQPLHMKDLYRLAANTNESFRKRLIRKLMRFPKWYFPDEHYRLGFEDVPVSYPIILEELLFSEEMFYEYFTSEIIDEMCRTWNIGNQRFLEITSPIIHQICTGKALDKKLVKRRVYYDFFAPIYISRR